VRRLGRLVDTILDLSRLERGQIDIRERPTDVVALLRTLLDFWRIRAEERPVLLKYEAPSIIANIDAGRLDQVMTNLVENSIKYGEGQIDVAIETDTKVLVLTVRDQGPGISREEREKVFERMYRSEKGLQNSNSLGLGLYISKQIVEGHGGTIRVLDEKTSCFEVRLPMVSH
jgi:signal transduction histidine kinase